MKLPVQAGQYDVEIEEGSLSRADRYLALDRKVLIVTDTGVPKAYAEALAACCGEPCLCRVPAGEQSKTLAVLETLLTKMLELGFTRKDCVAALGGGMVGDLAGFAAASYMRGIDFYNLPTTVLSQVDSSIGGKTGLNLAGVKNVVGAFYPPKYVLIDPETLQTLPRRQVAEGLAEALKMALLFDENLVRRFETENLLENPAGILAPALGLKARVVAQDEREQDLRRVLNFGHTIGHGIEAAAKGRYFHGECVAMGMLPLCSPAVRQRLLAILNRLGLPTSCDLSAGAVYQALLHDKKAQAGRLTVVECPAVGTYLLRKKAPQELLPLIAQVVKGA